MMEKDFAFQHGFIAEVGGTPAGFISFTVDQGKAKIGWMAVSAMDRIFKVPRIHVRQDGAAKRKLGGPKSEAGALNETPLLGKDAREIPLHLLSQQEGITYLPGDMSFIYSTEANEGAPLMRVDCR